MSILNLLAGSQLIDIPNLPPAGDFQILFRSNGVDGISTIKSIQLLDQQLNAASLKTLFSMGNRKRLVLFGVSPTLSHVFTGTTALEPRGYRPNAGIAGIAGTAPSSNNTPQKFAMSPLGNGVTAACHVNSVLRHLFWQWSPSGNFFAGPYSYIVPASQFRPTVDVAVLKYSPSGNALIYGQTTSKLRAYALSSGLYIHTNLPTPADLNMVGVSSVTFTADGSTVILGGYGGETYAAYRWNDATGFGQKLSGPAAFPQSTTLEGKAAYLSQDESKVALLSYLSGEIACYAFNKETGFGERLGDPIGHVKTGNCVSSEISPGKNCILRGLSVAPYLEVIRWGNEGFGTALETPQSVISGISTMGEIVCHAL